MAPPSTASRRHGPPTASRSVDAPPGSERQLVERIAQGDHEAFDEVYHRYYQRVFGYLLRVLGRPGSIEEVLDDVMLAVWQGARRFDGRSRVSTWIFGIAHHKALKALDRDRRESERGGDDPGDLEHEPVTGAGGPEASAVRSELRRKLRRAMETLSPVQRAAVELTFYYGYSYPEVAEILGCPVGTVKTRMFHARRMLKERLPALGLQGDEGLT